MHQQSGAAAPTCHLYTQSLGDTCGAKLTHHTHTETHSSHTIHTQPLGTLDLGQTQALSGILRPVRGFQTLLIGGSLLALVLTTDHDLGQHGAEVCFSFSLEKYNWRALCFGLMAECEVASSI